MPKKVFITGASGCVGNYLIEMLLAKTDYELYLLVRDRNKLVAAAAVRLLNATARFGPEIAQDALSSPDLRVETHHLLSFILALCAS